MYVITGGGSGIGRATALALAATGERVLISGRRESKLAEVAAEGAVATAACDHTDPAAVERWAAGIDEPVRGVVHCAGGNPAIGRPDPASLADVQELVRETLDSNLTSAALTLTALEPHLADGASVVLVGSIAAERGVGFYGPAKAAVGSYAVGRAADLGTRGIRVNCLSPGFITDTEFFAGTMTPERAEALRGQSLNGRVGDLDDAVATIEFLLADASRHITGQTLHLNGGAHTTR